jgi:hypothetical protein
MPGDPLPPSLIDLDALLTGSTTDEDVAVWAALVRASDAGDRWRRAQKLRDDLDRVVELLSVYRWLVEPWAAVRATRRYVTEQLPKVLAGGFDAALPAPLGVLGPASDAASPPQPVALRWGKVVTLNVAVGTVIAVRPPPGISMPVSWCSANSDPTPSPRWRLEAGEAPLFAFVEQSGARAGLVVLEG